MFQISLIIERGKLLISNKSNYLSTPYMFCIRFDLLNTDQYPIFTIKCYFLTMYVPWTYGKFWSVCEFLLCFNWFRISFHYDCSNIGVYITDEALSAYKISMNNFKLFHLSLFFCISLFEIQPIELYRSLQRA